MELILENIGIFTHMEFNFSDNKLSILTALSAAGKTTISKILYAYLTGIVDTSLVGPRGSSGGVILNFKNKKYKLIINNKNNATVEKILDDKHSIYGDQLVLNEISPILMSIYNKMDLPIENVINRLFPKPSKLKELERKLVTMPSVINIDESIKLHEKMLTTLKSKLKILNEELEKINKKLKEVEVVEKLNPLLEYLREKEKVKGVEQEIDKRKKEYSRIITELQKYDISKLQEQRRDIALKLDKLNRKLYTYKKVAELLDDIAFKFEELEPHADVLTEHYVVLVGDVFLDVDTIREVKDNLRLGSADIRKKIGELEAEAKTLEEELSSIDSKIEAYTRLDRNRRSTEMLISRLEEELTSMRNYIRALESQVKNLLNELGITQEEALRMLSSSDKSSLLLEKNRIEIEINRINISIKDYKARLETLRKEAEEIKKKSEEVARLKEEYEKLKSEWVKKKKEFHSMFMEEFASVFDQVEIRDYDPKRAVHFRPAHTYSQSERFMVAFAYLYALAKTLLKFGYPVPLIVIDLFVPVDKVFENAMISKLSELEGVTRIMLRTGNQEYKIEVVS